MHDRILSLKAFVRVAHAGSFSKAAAYMGLSQPSVSRLINALERELETPLVSRTTRLSLLTDAGKRYLERVEPILAKLEEANALPGSDSELTGTLRICLSVGFAIREVLPRLEQFHSLHTALRIELITAEKTQSSVRDGIDLALVGGELAASNSTCRRIGTERRMIVASPAYLLRASPLVTPDDVASHRAISWLPAPDSEIWALERDGRPVSVKPRIWLKVSAEEAAVSAAVQGLGVLMCSGRACRLEIQHGELRPVLSDWTIGPLPFYALFPGGRGTKRAARVFVDYLAEKLTSDSGPTTANSCPA
jgi:DNA-binding transcriptional LysR family regulator